MTAADFDPVTLPVVGKSVARMGLAPNYGLSTSDTAYALERPDAGYIFWTPRMRKATPALRDALAKERERYVVATGPTTGWWSGNLTRFVDKTRKTLGIDQIDVLQLFWLRVTSGWRPSVVEELVSLRESGAVKAIGAVCNLDRLTGLIGHIADRFIQLFRGA